ncbi:MAG: DUF4350 domain-containing protein [Planctomycetaceae bacterium]
MLSVRNLILVSILVFVTSITLVWASLFSEPDSNGLGRDTYGTRANGFRALFDVVRELSIPAGRDLSPPKPLEPGATLVLLQPDRRIVGTESSYLRSLLPWVEQGGRLVVVLSRSDQSEFERMVEERMTVDLPALLEVLDLSSVEVISTSARRSGIQKRRRPGRLDDEYVIEELGKILKEPLAPPFEVEVATTGTLAHLDVDRLAIAGDGMQLLDCQNARPSGTITHQTLIDGVPSAGILVAEFRRDKGSIVLISDPVPFQNRFLARADNSVMAVQLLSPTGSHVRFDEFYHGLGVRGNPLYLMTRPGYACFLLGLLLLACLAVWREAIVLGPALPDEIVIRRDIGEYVKAMGRFFSHGIETRPYLINQVRAGVFRELSRRFGLPLECQNAELITRAMSRRDPVSSERFQKVVTEIDGELRSRKRWSESNTIDAMRRLIACLSTPT